MHKTKPHETGRLHRIDQRQQAEEALRWKAALLEALVNTSIDGICVVDENGTRTVTNRRLIDLWNIPQHIVDDKNDAALLEYVVSLVKYPEQFKCQGCLSLRSPVRDKPRRDRVQERHGLRPVFCARSRSGWKSLRQNLDVPRHNGDMALLEHAGGPFEHRRPDGYSQQAEVRRVSGTRVAKEHA